MLKRLSQKSRKLRCYVRSCLSKNVPRSSKVHHSKVKYQSLALSLTILFLLLVFIGFNTFKIRFGIAYIVTITIVQAMVNVGLLFAWSCMCLVEDMINTLDDCASTRGSCQYD